MVRIVRGGISRSTWRMIATALAVTITSPADGLTYDVDRFDDPTPSESSCTAAGTDCSLRGAIEAANVNAGLDTINVPVGIYILDPARPPLTVDDSVTIDGDGDGSGDCDGGTDTCILGSLAPPPVFGLPPVKAPLSDGPVIVIESGTATISGVTIRHGNEDDGLGGGVVVFEGAALDISDCSVDTNYAAIGGGGIANFGTLDVEDCDIDGNRAGLLGGGGLFNAGIAHVTDSEITGDGPTDVATTNGFLGDISFDLQDIGFCGGVLNVAELTLTDSAVVGYAGLVGGGICNTPLDQDTADAVLNGAPPSFGDAILTLNDTFVAGNFAILGGGIWNHAGSLVVNAVVGSSGLDVGTAFTRLENESIVGYNASIFGGGIMNSRLHQAELMGPAPDILILAEFFGADEDLLDDLYDIGFGPANQAATSAPGLPSFNVGQARLEVVESAIGENFAFAGGGILNDQYLVPIVTYALLDGLATTNAAMSGLIPSDLTLPEDVSTVISESLLILNGAPIGAGVATFASTLSVDQSDIVENIFFTPFLDLATPATTNAPGGSFISAGGGIYNAFGPVDITESIFYENISLLGGGIANVSGEAGVLIPLELVFYLFQDFGLAGNSLSAPLEIPDITTLSIDSSTFVYNQSFYEGGGLDNIGGDADIVNTTFSGNEAHHVGGAIANFHFGHVGLSHVTIADNEAERGGGIFEDSSNQTIVLRSTIVWGNIDSNDGDSGTPDCELANGTILSAGSNLIGNDNGCESIFIQPGDQVGADAMLAPLDGNNGLTPTHRLLVGSDAIDAVVGECEDLNDEVVNVDQRGFARPFNLTCDIGAYEHGCGDGVVDDPVEECDPGAPDPDDCCTDECQLLPTGYVCNPAADICDPEEMCQGTAECPEDVPFLDSDMDSVCDGLEPDDTENDPGTASIQPPGAEGPIVTAQILGDGACNQIVDLQFLQESDLPVEDEGGNYPAGLVSVEVCSDDGEGMDGDPCDGTPPCINGQIKVTFDQYTGNFGNPGFAYRFFDPAGNEYDTLPTVDLMGNMAILTLSDGGFGDTSATNVAVTNGNSGSDGRIRNTGGPAVLEFPAPAPTMPLSGLVMSILILLGIAAVGMRRNRTRGFPTE